MRNRKVLRISVTDRCDLRCIYCMPESGVTLVPSGELLSYEEIAMIADAALSSGIGRIRITGGEPLVRRGLPVLVEKIARLGPEDLALTTNGLHLEAQAARLHEAGLRRITISLDTLRRDRFTKITRRDGFDAIMNGIEAARQSGLRPVKINTVIIRGVNDDEIPDFARFAEQEQLEVRFIELMPTSGLTHECKELGSWRPSLFLRSDEIRRRVLETVGPLTPSPERDGVADIYVLGSGARIGFISPVSRPFCEGCERLRLSADGRLKLCLFDKDGADMKNSLRKKGIGPEGLQEIFKRALGEKGTWTRGDLEVLSSDMFKIGG